MEAADKEGQLEKEIHVGDFTDLMNNIPELSPMAKRETYVDQHGIEIQVITPLSGSAVQYISALEVQTNQGPMRLQFGIRAESLEDAAKGWRVAAKEALQEFGKKMLENQRRILLPDSPQANTVPFRTIN